MTETVLHTSREPVFPLSRYDESTMRREQMALVWVEKKVATRGHQCWLPGASSLSDATSYVDEGSVIQCLMCGSYWRLYCLGDYGIPNWDQVAPAPDGGWKALRSRFIKIRHISNGGGPIWPWRVNA